MKPVMNSSFPNGDVTLSDGSTAEFQDAANFLVLCDNRYLVGKGRTMLTVGKRNTEADGGHARALWEAAQSPNSTFEGLSELARRLTYTFEGRDQGLPAAETSNLNTFANMLGARLRGMEGFKRLKPFPASEAGEAARITKGRFDWEGAEGPLYVTLVLSPAAPDRFGYLDVGLDLSHTFFTELGMAHTSAHVPLVLNPGSKVDLSAEEAPFLLLEATKLQVDEGVRVMMGGLTLAASRRRG